MARATFLKYAEAAELLKEFDTPMIEVQLFKNTLVDPLSYVFMAEDDKTMFVMAPISAGLFDMHIYKSDDSTESLTETVAFCKRSAKRVKEGTPGMKGAINTVKAADRHLRIMMLRYFKSEKLKTFNNGDTLFFTSVDILEGV